MQDLLDLNIEEGRMLDVDAAWGVIDFHAQRTQDRGHREMAGDDVNGVEIGEKRLRSCRLVTEVAGALRSVTIDRDARQMECRGPRATLAGRRDPRPDGARAAHPVSCGVPLYGGARAGDRSVRFDPA